MTSPLPTIGQTYNYFDDGKIKQSRLYTVKITKIVPFEEIDKDTLDSWKEDVQEFDFLYNKENDYFVFGKFTNNREVVFVRDINNEWFSIGWEAGLLDVEWKYTEIMNNY